MTDSCNTISIGHFEQEPVHKYIMTLLPEYFSKDIKNLIINTFLKSLPYDDHNVIIIGAGSETFHCSHVTIIGTNAFAVNCRNCIIHRVGQGSRVYLNYTGKVFND